MDKIAVHQNAPTRAFNWLLRDRDTGKIVVAELPNLPLALFLTAALMRWLLHLAGPTGMVFSAFAALTLGWWCVDEIARGVNPFRRILGGVVLAMTVAGLVMR